MLNFLLRHSADLSVTVRGLIWGKGYEWETFIPAVNPISYACMGLLPQMHRDPATISRIISILLHHVYNIDYTLPNIPNAYLKQRLRKICNVYSPNLPSLSPLSQSSRASSSEHGP